MELLLIKLARFIRPEEQKSLAKTIENFFTPFATHVQIRLDEWGTLNRLIVEIVLKNGNLGEIIANLLEVPGISTVVLFSLKLFDFEVSTFPSIIEELKNYISSYSLKNDYNLDLKAAGGVPFHKKAMIDRLKRKNFHLKEHSQLNVYLEVRSSKKSILDTKQRYQVRIGRKFFLKSLSKEIFKTINPKLVLYSPFTTQEIADFFRLGLVFNVPIIITNENNLAQKLVEKVKKTYFKGTSKISFQIIQNFDTYFSEKNMHCFGFSLWGTQSVTELPLMIKSLITDVEKLSIYLMFGNEKIGLPLFIRNSIPIFHIGGKASEPLRASQAAAYALGTLNLL